MFRFLMIFLLTILLAAYALIPSAESAWRRLRQPRYRYEMELFYSEEKQ